MDKCVGSVGAVLETMKVLFIEAASLLLPHIPSAAMAEAMAIKESLALANRMAFHRVIGESDSMETIGACKGEARWWNESSINHFF